VENIFKENPMLKTLSTRKAAIADIPNLAQIIYEASLPPTNHCYWEDILVGTNTSALIFLEATLRTDTYNWGCVSDFIVLEEQGKFVAAAAGYVPNPENYCPLQLDNLDKIAAELHWNKEVTNLFHEQYLQYWGSNEQPDFLTPQAPWIIENVAVMPNARGRGLGKVLLKALLEEGRSQQYSHAGIMIINGNDVARRTYESIGFKPYKTFHAEYFISNFNLEFSGVTKFIYYLIPKSLSQSAKAD
jgi:ribosomal protein S18 acetylase RimI-like enzyme